MWTLRRPGSACERGPGPARARSVAFSLGGSIRLVGERTRGAPANPAGPRRGPVGPATGEQVGRDAQPSGRGSRPSGTGSAAVADHLRQPSPPRHVRVGRQGSRGPDLGFDVDPQGAVEV